MGVGDDPSVGTLLAGYRLEAVLGRDSFGSVYLARDERAGRHVVLRLLSPELTADEGFRERFLRESQLAGSLDHPSIVPVYDAGEADGRLYVAMGDVDGVELSSLLEREGRLAPERAFAVVRQLAEALDAARFGRGLVHGALSPAEVLVVPASDAGSGERVLVSGFGLRRELSPAGQPGALDYLAPEQIEGGPVSPRTDVYALGCVLFHCLTGRHPFVGTSAEARLYELPPPVARFHPGLPAGVEAVLAKALSKWPEERYSTCGELAAAARASAEERPERERLAAVVPDSEPVLPSEELLIAEPAAGELTVGPDSWVQRFRRGGWKSIAAVGLAGLLAGLAAAVVWLAARGTDDASSATPGSSSVAQAAGPATGGPAESELPPPFEEAAAQAAERAPGPFGAGADDSPEPVLSRLPGSLVQIGARTGGILSRMAIPGPTLLASDGEFVWVLAGEAGNETLVRIDAAADSDTAIFDAAGLIPDDLETSWIDLAAVGGGAWLNDQQGAYRLGRGASAAELVGFADQGSTLNVVGGQVAASGSLWVSAFPPGPCCTPPPDLYRVDPATGTVIARFEGVQEVVAAGPGFVWALGEYTQGFRPLMRIDTETNTAVPIGVLELLWTDLTVADGAVWASSPSEHSIVRHDPVTGEEQGRIVVEAAPGALAAGGGAVWAALGNGTVARYDIATGGLETFEVGGTPRDMVFAAGSVWVAVDEPLTRELTREQYTARVDTICTAAHARLNEELQAAGIELESPPGAVDDEVRLALIPTGELGILAYDRAARRITAETLPELRALSPPEDIHERFDHLYGLMDEFARGVEEPFTPTPEYWIHQVEQEPSLVHCTFALGR